jgi:hypothetical protein
MPPRMPACPPGLYRWAVRRRRSHGRERRDQVVWVPRGSALPCRSEIRRPVPGDRRPRFDGAGSADGILRRRASNRRRVVGNIHEPVFFPPICADAFPPAKPFGPISRGPASSARPAGWKGGERGRRRLRPFGFVRFGVTAPVAGQVISPVLVGPGCCLRLPAPLSARRRTDDGGRATTGTPSAAKTGAAAATQCLRAEPSGLGFTRGLSEIGKNTVCYHPTVYAGQACTNCLLRLSRQPSA